MKTVFTLLGLPVLVVAAEAASFHARNRSSSLVSSGTQRDYVLFVPRSYDASRATPLVISMHGAGLWGAAHRDMAQWNRVAEREGFIVAYPSGMRGHGPQIWHVEESPLLALDVRFIADLIDSLSARYNIDATRIYADGLSNGGGMAFVLSCTLPGRIAAVGLVASAQTLPWRWCPDRTPVPVMALHGTADPVIPYRGGRAWISPRPFPGIASWMTSWAERNGCAPIPVDTAVAPDVRRRHYTGCARNADVVLYTIDGGGHTWPGGGRMPEWFVGTVNRSLDGTETLWSFYREHPLRR